MFRKRQFLVGAILVAALLVDSLTWFGEASAAPADYLFGVEYYGPGPANPYLYRIDLNGNIVWEKPLPFTEFALWGWTADRNLKEDAFYLPIFGESNKIDGKSRIQKYSASGALEWDLPLSPNLANVAANPVVGGCYAADDYEQGIYRIDANGTILWGPINFGLSPGPGITQWTVAADPTTGGGFAIHDVYWSVSEVIRFDRDGQVLWMKTMYFPVLAWANPLDGGVYIGAEESANHLYRLDAAGEIVWDKPTFPSMFGAAHAVSPVDGSIYAAGTYPERLSRVAMDGTVLWVLPNDDGQGHQSALYSLAADTRDDVFYSADRLLDSGFSKFNGADFTRIWHIDPRHGGNEFYVYMGTPPSAVPLAFDLTPNTFNLASQGLWVTGFLEPPPFLSASDIDIASIRLNGTVLVDPAAPTAIGDHDSDGVPDLMVKFNRADVELILSDGDNVPVTVTGSLGIYSFTGTDYIRVRRAVVTAPLAGSHLTAGSPAMVSWQIPSSVTVQSVALLSSLDNGRTWDLIARGHPNTGSYDWTVPNVQTDQAKVAVVLVESSDETGYIVDGVLGVSEAFSITTPTGVGDGPVTFALSVPNPSAAHVAVTFALPAEAPAALELLDVTGRRLVAREVGSLGVGRHTINLGEGRRLSPGLYFIRLTQGSNRKTERVVVMR